MRKPWLWCAASLLAVSPAMAATVLLKHVEHRVRADGSVLESTRLEVRIDRAEDLDTWSRHGVAFDDHQQLRAIEASVVKPDGEIVKVKPRDHDEVELSPQGILHSSLKVRVVPFPRLSPGSVIRLRYELITRPHFPTGSLFLLERDTIEKLEVEVSSDLPGWRFNLEGGESGFEVVPSPNGVRLRATGLAAASEKKERRFLLYGWGEETSWRDVGEWYEGLLAPLARQTPAVRQEALALTAGLGSPREKLEALVAFARRKVRYVAVEVGIGGYRPFPPAEVLDRRWGDCKDKSLLLIDLLAAVGIEAHPVIVRAASDRPVDPSFPTPGVFNHLIVAVPVAGLEVSEDDPVTEGFLIIDPTQERGGGRWLHPMVQGQRGLLVHGAESRLLSLPVRPAQELRRLAVSLAPAPDGSLAGELSLSLQGLWAAIMLERLAGPDPEQAMRELLDTLAPELVIDQLAWGSDERELPAVALRAKVKLRNPWDEAGTPALQVPWIGGLPEPRDLEDVASLAVRPQRLEVRWQVPAPAEGCTSANEDVAITNELGELRQTVRVDAGQVVVERAIEVRARWVEGEALGRLRELALAERRTEKRRLRIACSN